MANLTYRQATQQAPVSTTTKNASLTSQEIDGNFKSLNDELITKAPLVSPGFSGVPTAPTATAGTNTTQLATTAFVQTGLSNRQPLDATLTALSGVTTAADQLIYSTASDTFSTTSITSFGRSIIDDADASTARTTLGLGTAAVQSDDRYAHRSNNLSDLANMVVARSNLGLSNSATIAATNLNTSNTIVQRDASGNFSAGTITASLSGNATTANALTTARTISLVGDVTGSVSFNGSANANITATVVDDSHNHIISNVDGLQTALDMRVPIDSSTGAATIPSGSTAQRPTGTIGDFRFNTSLNRWEGYGQSGWDLVGGSTSFGVVDRFSGTGVQLSFNLSQNPGVESNTQVYINGIYQQKDTYSLSGTTITFSEPPPVGTDNIEVVSGVTLALGETDASLVGFQQAGTGTVVRTAQNKMREVVSVKDFGAIGDGVADDTAAMQAAINHVITNDKRLLLPAGTYSYSGLNNIKTSGFCMVGEGSDVVTLQYTGTGNALSFDAFIAGGPSDPFVNGLLVGGFSVVGATMTKGLYVQGVARSEFFDVKVNGSNGVDGTVGFHFAGTMLSKMTRLHCSYVDGSVPYRGMWFTAGTRAGVSVGACSNNVIESAYPEGNSIGIQISANGGDQNVFLGGSPEACTVYGLLIGTACRYNTFIGLGFENPNVTNQDVNDAGIYSRYINCYSSEHFLISGASRGIHVSGGYFERLEIASGAQGATVEDVAVNNWATGSGGFFNSGTGTRWANVYDLDAAAYLFKTKARAGIAVGASPFAYTNNEGIPMKIRVIGGTVTQVQFTRQGDSWIEENPSASGGGTGTVGTYLLMPGDVITISYSVAPTMNSIPLSGF